VARGRVHQAHQAEAHVLLGEVIAFDFDVHLLPGVVPPRLLRRNERLPTRGHYPVEFLVGIDGSVVPFVLGGGDDDELVERECVAILRLESEFVVDHLVFQQYAARAFTLHPVRRCDVRFNIASGAVGGHTATSVIVTVAMLDRVLLVALQVGTRGSVDSASDIDAARIVDRRDLVPHSRAVHVVHIGVALHADPRGPAVCRRQVIRVRVDGGAQIVLLPEVRHGSARKGEFAAVDENLHEQRIGQIRDGSAGLRVVELGIVEVAPFVGRGRDAFYHVRLVEYARDDSGWIAPPSMLQKVSLQRKVAVGNGEHGIGGFQRRLIGIGFGYLPGIDAHTSLRPVRP